MKNNYIEIKGIKYKYVKFYTNENIKEAQLVSPQNFNGIVYDTYLNHSFGNVSISFYENGHVKEGRLKYITEFNGIKYIDTISFYPNETINYAHLAKDTIIKGINAIKGTISFYPNGKLKRCTVKDCEINGIKFFGVNYITFVETTDDSYFVKSSETDSRFL